MNRLNRNCLVSLLTLVFALQAHAQIVRGNPSRNDLNIALLNQSYEHASTSVIELTLNHNERFSSYVHMGNTGQRYFSIFEEELEAEAISYGIGLGLELESYRAGNIHWELTTGYEQTALVNQSSEDMYQDVQIKMLSSSISAVWDIPQSNKNNHTRLGLKITGIMPKSFSNRVAYWDETLKTPTTHRLDDIYAFMVTMNTTPPWIHIPYLGIEGNGGVMVVNNTWQWVSVIGFRLGVNIF
jgi:hypothetical protein